LTFQITWLTLIAGRSGLVVARLPAAREVQEMDRTRATDSLCVFHENYCDSVKLHLRHNKQTNKLTK